LKTRAYLGKVEHPQSQVKGIKEQGHNKVGHSFLLGEIIIYMIGEGI
jgi:hypothetical protein